MGVDDRRHGIGRVVKAVHELEAESDDQSDPEQQVRQDRADGRTRVDDIRPDAVGRKGKAACDDENEDDRLRGMYRMVQFDPLGHRLRVRKRYARHWTLLRTIGVE